MKSYTDDSPILVTLDEDGYLVQAGDPVCMDKKTLLHYVQSGYTMKMMKLREFQALELTWIYNKPGWEPPKSKKTSDRTS